VSEWLDEFIMDVSMVSEWLYTHIYIYWLVNNGWWLIMVITFNAILVGG
jgi:hypothetical protein